MTSTNMNRNFCSVIKMISLELISTVEAMTLLMAVSLKWKSMEEVS